MFNAIAYSKELEQAGFSRNQAEATINVFFKFMEYNFATKSDLFSVKADLHKDITSLRTDFKSELKSEVTSLSTELKTDIASLRTEIKTELAALKSELKSDILNLQYQIISLENKMTIKFGIMQAATIGILAAIIKLT